jgi:spore germination protein
MNKKVKNTWIFIIVTLIVSMFLQGCSRENNLSENNKEENEQIVDNDNKETFDVNIDNLSAWVAYWDLDVQGELMSLDKQLKEISYFAAYFDLNNELTMPKQLINYYDKTRHEDYIKYLTIVNDKINSDGSSSLKNTDLLKSLLADSNLRSKHVKEIIDLTSQYGFNGIEIDYEQIKGDMELWNNYLLFIKELYNECDKIGLKLRVILEPNTPFDNLEFVEGPTYVMMCYNLHGGFSKPGEKANPKFIKELMDKMKSVPGDKKFAIATGGFNWASDGKVTSLSEVEAQGLVKEYVVKEERDTESQGLVFKYTDRNSIEHEVWYADKNTLNSWMKVIEEEGYGISIWRLGGNVFQ